MEYSIYIYHHLGMGDSLLCNGLVRYYAELYDKVYVFAQPINFDNVVFMYRDNPCITIICKTDAEVKSFMRLNPNHKYLMTGHTSEYVFKLNQTKEFTFEEGFYKMANVPFEYKWSKFYLQRDFEKEKEAFEIAGIKKGEEYSFIHDDVKRGRIFKPEYINNSLKSIHPAELQTINFFYFLSIIENAKEIHVHNSSFANIIDTMQLKVNNLFYHKYIVKDCRDQIFNKNMNWIFYE